MRTRKKAGATDPTAPADRALMLHQLAAAARARNPCCPLCAEVREPVTLADGSAALACPRCGDVAPVALPDETQFRAPAPASPPA